MNTIRVLGERPGVLMLLPFLTSSALASPARTNNLWIPDTSGKVRVTSTASILKFSITQQLSPNRCNPTLFGASNMIRRGAGIISQRDCDNYGMAVRNDKANPIIILQYVLIILVFNVNFERDKEFNVNYRK